MPQVIYQDDKITKVMKDDGQVVTIANSQAQGLLKDLGGVTPQEAPITQQEAPSQEQLPWDTQQAPQSSVDPQFNLDSANAEVEKARQLAQTNPDQFNQIVNDPNRMSPQGKSILSNQLSVEQISKLPSDKFQEEYKKASPEVQKMIMDKTNSNSTSGPVQQAVAEAPSVAKSTLPSVASQSQPTATAPKENEFEKIQKWYETKTAERKSFLDAEKTKLEKETQIDPNRVLGSTSSKILAAISLAFGGIGQGLMRSGSNAAADMLNKIIDRDIDAQKTDASKRTQAYRDLIQSTGDEVQTGLLLKTQALDYATKENQRVIDNKYKTEEQKRQATLANAQIGEIKASTAGKLLETVNKGVQTQLLNNPSIPKPLREISKITNEADKKQAQEEYNALQNNKSVTDNIGSIFDKVAKTGALQSSVPFTDTKAEIDNAINLFKNEFARSMGGPITESDLKTAEAVAPQRTDTPKQTLAKKAQMVDYINRRLIQSSKTGIGTLQRYGIIPANGDSSVLFSNPKVDESNALGGVKPRGSK